MTDPIRARRERLARLAETGQRAGYLLLLAAVVVFVVGFVIGFSGGVVSAVVACVAVASALLVPSIIVGYAAKAAEREDRERGV